MGVIANAVYDVGSGFGKVGIGLGKGVAAGACAIIGERVAMSVLAKDAAL